VSELVINSSLRFPRYGDIWDTNFDPAIGTETAKRRPSLIVSNDFNNEFTNRVTVLPLTSRPMHDSYPFEVLVPKGTGGLTSDSRILANQIRTIDKKRLVSFRGTLPAQYLPHVERATKIHLNMR
jgi:mRNA interferase MazF